jgi:DNA-binding helix-hairpin-helix protein with protein kinase domain
LQALRAIHAKGVAHGDICEDNILMADDGKVGLAQGSSFEV